jgi:DtxR family manganese transport transcriptional regulator
LSEPADAARRAAAFQRMRDAHSTEMAEDYVELIGDLIAEVGEARLTDLAQNLGVSHATAAKVVQRLAREGLVESRPYRSIFLTAEGETVAAASRERHRIVHEFLLALGVSDRVAEADSEGIEHHVSAETLKVFERMTAELKSAG